MLLRLIEAKFALQPNLAIFILMFFGYSFMGYVLECIVLTVEKRHLVVNRGFVRRLPFCIIYGFGGMIGYTVLSPLKGHMILLFIVGAVAATSFEYFVARLQIRLFGDFWWDYTDKPFNYKGVLCLESTLGWGIVAILIVRVLHVGLSGVVAKIPFRVAMPIAISLLVVYGLDFIFSAKNALHKEDETMPEVEYYDDKKYV